MAIALIAVLKGLMQDWVRKSRAKMKIQLTKLTLPKEIVCSFVEQDSRIPFAHESHQTMFRISKWEPCNKLAIRSFL